MLYELKNPTLLYMRSPQGVPCFSPPTNGERHVHMLTISHVAFCNGQPAIAVHNSSKNSNGALDGYTNLIKGSHYMFEYKPIVLYSCS